MEENEGKFMVLSQIQDRPVAIAGKMRLSETHKEETKDLALNQREASEAMP